MRRRRSGGTGSWADGWRAEPDPRDVTSELGAAIARYHDGLTADGRDLLWATWNEDSFSVEAVLEALATDRANRLAFEQADPKAALALVDVLSHLSASFDSVESEAHRYAVASERWRLGAPELLTGGRYGGE